jgi:hypothetical protein
MERAPSVVPWYALRLVTNFVRVGSPRSRWYWRAILSADSTASEPPPTKKTRPTSIGRRSVSLSASASAGSCAKPTQLEKNGSASTCRFAASAISGHGP